MARSYVVTGGGRGIGRAIVERLIAVAGDASDEAVAEEAADRAEAAGTLAGAVVAHLLSDEASFVNGATIPVDGGRSVLAHDPEARRL
jgi:NAD(P)-dependent dehydrogenase (short-subunit alcohol dehydrogenase family)